MAKYGKAMTEKICRFLSEGKGRMEAVKLSGIHYDTFRTWEKTKPEFSEAIKKAEEQQVASREQIAVRSIFTAMEEGRWQAAAWWLERTMPHKYKERKEIKQEISESDAKERLAEALSKRKPGRAKASN